METNELQNELQTEEIITLQNSEIEPGVFRFPSLITGKIRGMTVKEEDLLLNRQNIKAGNIYDLLIDACVDVPVSAKEMLIGDRVFALLQIRRLTHGDKFTFSKRCPSCNKQFEWEEDISGMEVIPLLELDQANDGYLFTFTLPQSNKTLKWKMLRGKDEKRLEEARRNFPDEVSTYVMFERVVEIEGEGMAKPSFFKNLSSADAAAFRDEFNHFEPGVETSIEIECPQCDHVDSTELPVSFDFFLNSGTKKHKKRRRR